MTFARRLLFMAVSLALAGCGGGSGPVETALPAAEALPEPAVVIDPRVAQVAPLGAVEMAFVAGEAVPSKVTMFGLDGVVTRALAGTPIFTDGSFYYAVASGPGESYALAGYTPGSSGVVGSAMQVLTPAPTGGSVTYGGAYAGVLTGPNGGFYDDIRGVMTMDADFDAGVVSGTITNRSATTVAGYAMGRIVSDVAFEGIIAGGTGEFSAEHSDWNSIGVLNGYAHEAGAVGVASLRHVDAAGAGVDVFEVSAFSVE